jgi:hypothetical protein
MSTTITAVSLGFHSTGVNPTRNRSPPSSVVRLRSVSFNSAPASAAVPVRHDKANKQQANNTSRRWNAAMSDISSLLIDWLLAYTGHAAFAIESIGAKL